MAKRKLTHEELQRDEVAEGLQETLDSLRRNRNKLIGLAAVAILVAIVYAAVSGYQARVLRESNEMFANAMTAYARLLSAADDEQRRGALGDMITELDTLIETYGTSPLGRAATFLKGRAYYAIDDYPKAQEAYEQYLAQTQDDAQKARGEIALAYSLENESFFLDDLTEQRAKLDQARVHYELAAAASPKPSFLYYYALLGQARYHELVQEEEQAIALLEEVVAERPAPVTDPAAAAGPDPDEDPELALVKMAIREREAQLSLAATARQRLERLRARQGLDEAVTEVTTQVTGSP